MKALIFWVTNYVHKRPFLFLGSLVVLTVTVGFMLWPVEPPALRLKKIAAPLTLSAAPTPDLLDPAEDFNTYLHVVQTGGCEITRPAAISWLDFHERRHLPLSANNVESVMALLRAGGHRSWESSYRQHLFNSAFNALQGSDIGSEFTLILRDLAVKDADPVMRLYALQHLGMQRRNGLLSGTLADEIHTLLETLARNSAEAVSGTAIQVLAAWDGTAGAENDTATMALALATAADPSRPVDVRVTALHESGPACLELARTLASDASSPVLLRKAAIAGIGRYGAAEDSVMLASFQAESSRIAQAVIPARKAIQDRLSNSFTPAPVPY
jgi:hypothetical protein